MAFNDIQFKSLDDCFDVIESYASAENIVAINDFEKCLKTLIVHHSKNGFSDEQLELLASFIISRKLRYRTIDVLIQCLVPKEMMPKDLVTKLLLYTLSFYNNINHKITIRLLKWFIALLCYELTDIAAIDDFYRLLYFMLDHESILLQNHVLILIYMLTKPEDVTDDKMLFISVLESKYGKRKNSKALLSLFKCYQPELVPMKTPVMEMMDLSKYISSCFMKESMNEAKVRTSKSNHNDPPEKLPIMKIFDGGCMQRKCNENIIPTPKYKDKETKYKIKITDIETIAELEKNIENLSVPSNLLSLLTTDIGLHFIAFAEKDIQIKFMYKVNETFDKVFIRQVQRASIEEKQFLLERLYDLQEYLKQGLFFVSRSLASYLQSWNGLEYFKEVLNLVKWITFSSYEEFQEMILIPLYTILISSEESGVWNIISALSELLINMVDLYRFRKGIRPVLLGVLPGWLADEEGLRPIGQIVKAIQRFIQIGVLLWPNSVIILNGAIGFYEVLADLETRSDIPHLTICDYRIVYRSFFSLSNTALSRVCRLLTRYPTIMNHIAMDKSASNFERELQLISMYNTDIMNCLWLNQAIVNRKNGIIFKEIPDSTIRDMNKIVKMDSAFSVQNHVMFLHYLITVSNLDSSLLISDLMTPQKLLDIMDTYAPSISNLIQRHIQ